MQIVSKGPRAVRGSQLFRVLLRTRSKSRCKFQTSRSDLPSPPAYLSRGTRLKKAPESSAEVLRDYLPSALPAESLWGDPAASLSYERGLEPLCPYLDSSGFGNGNIND